MAKPLLKITCEDQEYAIGIDTGHPCFSWKLYGAEADFSFDEIQIIVAEDAGFLTKPLWKFCTKSQEPELIYQGEELRSCTVYFVRMQLISKGHTNIISDTCRFETAFLKPECWKAKWINLSEQPLIPEQPLIDEYGDPLPVAFEEIKNGPVHQVRKEFKVDGEVSTARLYMTAHGVYLPMLDGERIGCYELAPGHSDYQNRLFYQIYDITERLKKGLHTIGAYVADGWYRSRMGFAGDNCQYGTELALLLQLEITYADGKKEYILSDESFEVTEGGWISADMMVGERYDAGNEREHFFENHYQSKSLRHPGLLQDGYANLKAQVCDFIEVLEVLKPVAWYRLNDNEIMLDFGKTVAGKVRIELYEKKGQVVWIEHSEVEGKDHTFEKNIIAPFRDQTDIYVCKGGGKEIYEPMFTYHGFRYVKISGITGEIMAERFQAKVIGTRMEQTGRFSCSDPRLNQLQENIVRSQLSNMISIPTDCPQREKAGWTGDVQIYAATACFNQNIKRFFKSWLEDVRYSQAKDGQIPIIVPFLPGYQRSFDGIDCSAGWSDVIVILPWTLYQYYGDKSILEENYEAMEKWVAYIKRTAAENPDDLAEPGRERTEHLKYIWNTGFHFGDWLTPSVSIDTETGMVDLMRSAEMTMDIVPTIFYAYSCTLLGRISEILGKKSRAAYYRQLFERIKEAFQYEYLDNDLTIKSGLQGIHVLALAFELVDGRAKEKTVEKLVALIRQNQDRLDTGFLSVPYLMDVLAENGHRDLAYKILYCEECPSWLYEVKMGATSMWESWQALLPDGKSSCLSMAHYAFGCIGDWMYRNIAGIRMMEPGYKKIRFQPDLDCGLSQASGSFESIYGTISCSWEQNEHSVKINVKVPFHTTAELVIGKKLICLKPGQYCYEFQKEEMSNE